LTKEYVNTILSISVTVLNSIHGCAAHFLILCVYGVINKIILYKKKIKQKHDLYCLSWFSPQIKTRIIIIIIIIYYVGWTCFFWARSAGQWTNYYLLSVKKIIKTLLQRYSFGVWTICYMYILISPEQMRDCESVWVRLQSDLLYYNKNWNITPDPCVSLIPIIPDGGRKKNKSL